MPKYWMINDRRNEGTGPDVNFGGLTFRVSDKLPLTDIKNWRKVTRGNFQKLLVAVADTFPALDATENKEQRHVTLLLRGVSSHPPVADDSSPTDNVRDIDFSSFFEPGVRDIHGAYFLKDSIMEPMRRSWRGRDRGALETSVTLAAMSGLRKN